MTPQEEAIFERKAERMLAGHRQPPNGRNIFAFVMRNLNNGGYKSNFDNVFPEAPGSEEWFKRKFGEQ